MRAKFSELKYAGAASECCAQAGGEKEPWLTAEQIPVKGCYSASDLEGMEHLNYAAGVAPFLRGPYSTMYVMRPWTIRQYAGFSTAEESNAFYRRNLASGQKGANEYAKLREGGSIQKRSSTVQGKIALDFRPVEGLSISGVVAPLFIYSKTKDFSKKIPYYDANEPGVVQGYISGHESTSLTESRSERIEWSKQLLLNYENSFASKHNVNFMLGYEDFTYNLENLSAGSDQFELNNFPYLDLGNKNYLSNSGDATTYAYRSYFGRLAYNFGNRYYVQANMRADGSSPSFRITDRKKPSPRVRWG